MKIMFFVLWGSTVIQAVYCGFSFGHIIYMLFALIPKIMISLKFIGTNINPKSVYIMEIISVVIRLIIPFVFGKRFYWDRVGISILCSMVCCILVLIDSQYVYIKEKM